MNKHKTILVFSLILLAVVLSLQETLETTTRKIDLTVDNSNPIIGQNVTFTVSIVPARENVRVSLLQNGTVIDSSVTDKQGKAYFILEATETAVYTAKLTKDSGTP